MQQRTADRGAFALDSITEDRARRHAERAIKRARRRGQSLVSVTVRLAVDVDPVAVVCASRRAGEAWFSFEQPERDRFALATLGCVAALEAAGRDRFASVSAQWRALVAGAVSDDSDGPRGTGPVAVGGFAFAPGGGSTPPWDGFAPASMHVPEVALARRGDDVRLTLATVATADDTVDDVVTRLVVRAAELRSAPLPMLDPAPAGRVTVSSAMPPEHYEAAVARGVERIKAGGLAKIVLAREVQVHAAAAHDAPAVLGILREAFPSCLVFACGRGDKTFLAATPELLVRRDGLRASTLALAGSTRRSADPAVDDHLGEQLLRSSKNREEQEIVTRRIVRMLAPHSVWVTAAEEPVVVKMANIQHLATPIRAQLAAPVGAIDLAGLLHPTPAVGGEPWAVAEPLIPAYEGIDRGWYAGPVGWTDATDDGEFCVALRCALLDRAVARCYAGVGVVRDSDPAAELAETDVKLQALLPILAL